MSLNSYINKLLLNICFTLIPVPVLSPPCIFKSPIERDEAKLPEIPLTDYLFSRLREKGLEKTDKIWVVR